MKFKRFFTVTYFANFRSSHSIYDRFTRFWIWNAPPFIDWVEEKRRQIKKDNSNEELVVIDCKIL